NGELMCLVKPLFETEDALARRTGVLAASAYVPLLCTLAQELNAQEGTCVMQVTHSPVTGNNGTHEFFMHVVFGEGLCAPDLRKASAEAVERALQLQKYHKG
ncbi:MAG: hypothetical protein RSB06_06830, partial [Clostridia bacterium]